MQDFYRIPVIVEFKMVNSIVKMACPQVSLVIEFNKTDQVVEVKQHFRLHQLVVDQLVVDQVGIGALKIAARFRWVSLQPECA